MGGSFLRNISGAWFCLVTFCFAVSMAFISLGYTITVVRSAVYIMGVLLPLIRSRLSAPGFTFSAAFPGSGGALVAQLCCYGFACAISAVFCSVGAELLDYANKTP